MQLGIKVFTNHLDAEKGAQLQLGLFDEGLYPVRDQCSEAVVASLPTQFLLPWLRFMSVRSYAVVCLRVPQSWVDNGEFDVVVFLHGLRQQKRLVQVVCVQGEHVPSRYCWLCLFKDQQQRELMLLTQVRGPDDNVLYLHV
jgi:hypothetical protein